MKKLIEFTIFNDTPNYNPFVTRGLFSWSRTADWVTLQGIKGDAEKLKLLFFFRKLLAFGTKHYTLHTKQINQCNN